ncbi:MAG: threonylcarbamoyl-AMP synthase [Proteobacteria bacterium]|nr:threonylcarbamoyl-AMP synthase [Pseudomonadota bacterium]HQR03074.1 L-threonylcarbamoyladenylate synthase [Rhodocyclaceae bacterium]
MSDIDTAVRLLRTGRLVALPTETVYGLGADASSPEAVARIFAAKGRPADHPLIVHIPAADHLDRWAREIPQAARLLAQRFWPGPLTLILKRQPQVPDAITGGQDTVGLRVPAHPLALQLLRAFDSGIAAPSANRFGRISPTTADHVREELGDRVDLVLDGGPCTVGIESTILDLSGPVYAVLRPGAITAQQIADTLGQAVSGATPAAPRVSGSLEAHYAPTTPMELVPAGQLPARIDTLVSAGLRVAVLSQAAFAGNDKTLRQQAPEDAAGYARTLYGTLRKLDHQGVARILVEAPPDTPEWLAIRDRLRRAARGSGE